MSKDNTQTDDSQAAPQSQNQQATTPVSEAELKRQLAAARQSLTAHLQRKKQLDKDLITLEVSIYNFETSYLTPDTSAASASAYAPGAQKEGFGNIVKGYENYLKQGGGSGGGFSDRKRNRNSVYGGGGGLEVHAEDRLFSNSSTTHQRVCLISLAAKLGNSLR